MRLTFSAVQGHLEQHPGSQVRLVPQGLRVRLRERHVHGLGLRRRRFARHGLDALQPLLRAAPVPTILDQATLLSGKKKKEKDPATLGGELQAGNVRYKNDLGLDSETWIIRHIRKES